MKFQVILLFFSIVILGTWAQTENQTQNFYTESTGSTDFIAEEYSTSEQVEFNYCKELYPYCSCRISSIIIQCRNFSYFSQLNFSLLINLTDNSPRRIYELELKPLNAIPLDKTLNLEGISLYGRVILYKISGLDLEANPFESIKENSILNLYLYDVNLETLDHDTICGSNLSSNYVSLFSSFNYVLVSEDTYTYSGYLCPLAFKNANLRKLEMYIFNSSSTIQFSSISNDFDLNITITALTVYSAKNFTIDSNFLNPLIFKKLEDLDFDFVELKSIEKNTFENFTSLKRIVLDLPNMADFLRSTDNEWMKSLNLEVTMVNYSNPNELSKFENKSLVVTFNSRSGQQYSFPNEDLERFRYFPHDRLVYARILADQNLECSDTLQFLLKNSFNYPSVSFLNTTSTYKCFLNSSEQTIQPTFVQTTTIISENPPDNVVSLGVYLGTTIPLAAISILSLTTAAFFYIRKKKVYKTDRKNHIELF
ncbi:hypothetical protein BpHYR1_013668 [Brachionus plicatilis]|uniref:Uncharacterized protein n=1 Tax=Brachionus plicatilis TaxID=10195 RepID=A0A3M7SXR4_BRAPC|nr:hypothetical protein BpHYR1_013668 [Brachionus plicatilis]